MMGERKDILKLGLYHTPMNDWLDDYDTRLEENTSSTKRETGEDVKNQSKVCIEELYVTGSH